jgi:ribonuclease P protein component
VGLPPELRLRRSADITAVVRRGRRARVGPLLLHVAPATAGDGPLRLATVTPRAVGNAVVRNRARRRVQAAALDLVRERAALTPSDVVVRFLPGSGDADAVRLRGSLARGLERLGVLAGPAAGGGRRG